VFDNAKTNLSAKEAKKSQNARVSETNEERRWAECFEEAEVEGSKETHGVVCFPKNTV
jgi:hypothetical protein